MRFDAELGEIDEIAFYQDSNSVPTWTIHRPLQGWYLAIQRVESNEEASEEPIALESSKRQQDPRHLSFVLDAPPQDEGKAKDEGGPVPPSPNVRLNFNQSGDEAILAAPSSSTLSTTPIATRSLLATALANSKDTKRKFTLQPHLSKEDQGKLDAGFLGWKKAFGVGVVCGSHYSCRWEEGDVEIFNFQDTSGFVSSCPFPPSPLIILRVQHAINGDTGYSDGTGERSGLRYWILDRGQFRISEFLDRLAGVSSRERWLIVLQCRCRISRFCYEQREEARIFPRCQLFDDRIRPQRFVYRCFDRLVDNASLILSLDSLDILLHLLIHHFYNPCERLLNHLDTVPILHLTSSHLDSIQPIILRKKAKDLQQSSGKMTNVPLRQLGEGIAACKGITRLCLRSGFASDWKRARRCWRELRVVGWCT